MEKKLKEILGSVRFWIVTLTAIIAILEMHAGGGVDLTEVLDVVKYWLIAVAGIGTLDKVTSTLSTWKKSTK